MRPEYASPQDVVADEPIRLLPEDVTVERIDPELCECGHYATHLIMVDFRATGMKSACAHACAECAEEIAQRVRESLAEVRP